MTCSGESSAISVVLVTRLYLLGLVEIATIIS